MSGRRGARPDAAPELHSSSIIGAVTSFDRRHVQHDPEGAVADQHRHDPNARIELQHGFVLGWTPA